MRMRVFEKEMSKLRIGISGFMGAGKTTCCTFVSAALRDAGLAVWVINADAEAKRIMQTDTLIQNKLSATFGKTIIGDGGIVFPVLGQLAFGTLSSLHQLNGIVHPVLLERLKKLIFCEEKGCTILDAALIPLWHIEEWFDVLIWVQSPFDIRYLRLREKLQLSNDELVGRMRLQERLMPEPMKARWIVIGNKGTEVELRSSVIAFCTAMMAGKKDETL
jgi:dephospho-CoA kinase